MFRRPAAERERSARGRATIRPRLRVSEQGVTTEFKTIPRAEVRCLHSSGEVGNSHGAKGDTVSDPGHVVPRGLRCWTFHFLRLIRRLLRNSILTPDADLKLNEAGTAQGSPASPVLANICLHYLLDEWFQEHFGGKGRMVRYADDAVFAFVDSATAHKFRQALAARLAEAGLRLNLDKSGVVPFSKGAPKGTVSFLGFQFYWGRDATRRKTLKLKTQPKRLSRSIQAFKEWVKLTRNRMKLDKLWSLARAKLQGHFNYFGVTYNEAKLSHFYFACNGLLFRWLNRRSQKRSFSWGRYEKRLRFSPLPNPPRGAELKDVTSERSSSKHQPKSRMRKLRTSGSVRSAGRQRPAFT